MKKVKVILRGRQQVGKLVEKYHNCDEDMQVVNKKQHMKPNGAANSATNSPPIVFHGFRSPSKQLNHSMTN